MPAMAQSEGGILEFWRSDLKAAVKPYAESDPSREALTGVAGGP